MGRLYLPKVPASEITPESCWQDRRRWLQQAGALAAGTLAWPALGRAQDDDLPVAARPPEYMVPQRLTSERDVTTYNNFYEFGTEKDDPSRRAGRMPLRPWTVEVGGAVGRPRTFDVDDLLKLAPLEERIYRLRCVEGWSMVIPWLGYSLHRLLDAVEPAGDARYVSFTTALMPEYMPGVSRPILDWPYVEGLRLDEAMHPLTMLVFGVYGKRLPAQNGAPMRLAVPWKYGFKSAKSLVRIDVLRERPATSWEVAAPREYGFYGNVNPAVPHPRWSQATERRIGDHLFAPRVPTQPFNGYGGLVASLYEGMDLRQHY